MKLFLLPDDYAICRLAPGESGDASWWRAPDALSLRLETPAETSILCPAGLVPEGVKAEGPWRAFELEGPLPFELVGVLHGVLGALAAEGISILAYSSFDTDYVLVPAPRVADARAALEAAGYELRTG